MDRSIKQRENRVMVQVIEIDLSLQCLWGLRGGNLGGENSGHQGRGSGGGKVGLVQRNQHDELEQSRGM